jgi:hypothetical protein
MSVETKTCQFAVQMPEQLRRALEHAAARRFTNSSEYARQGIIEKMRADGIDPLQVLEAFDGEKGQ